MQNFLFLWDISTGDNTQDFLYGATCQVYYMGLQ